MRYRPVIVTIVGLITTLLLIGFANIDNDRRVCNRVMVSIDNQLHNHFIDDTDVLNLLTNGYTEAVEGAAFADLNIRTLENRVKANDYVREAEIFRDLKGNLLVKVVLRRPVARVIQPDGPDAYIAGDGTILPVSDKFSARVLLVSGAVARDIAGLGNIKASDHRQLFALINFINADKFWRAQITQVDVQPDGDIKLLPQVTKQYIEFGDLQDMKNKFARLKIFYTKILPRKGWNSYSRVSVKYKNQIICE